MNAAQEHYDALLGGVYRWYVSASGDPFSSAHQWLKVHLLLEGSDYLDLGAGFGAHVKPLLENGKTVTAVDFNSTLLTQLKSEAAPWAGHCTTHKRDVLEYLESSRQDWDVILCLGDTLTHLPDFDCVRRLLVASYLRLRRHGQLAISYRDSTGFSAQGTQRFIPVAHDQKRSLQCLLEPLDSNYLRVTDILTELGDNGLQTQVSDYMKLRLASEQLITWAKALQFQLSSQTTSAGMTTLVLRK